MEASSCCSNPGCDQPGTSKCSACKATPYCGPTCQTADWPHHKEECEGHLLKVGNAHLAKVNAFCDADNWAQTLRYSDLAVVKFNAVKKRPLKAISEALACKFAALRNLSRHAEALQCAKDNYNQWAVARGPAHPFTIQAAFFLIEALIKNKEFEDAHLFARTLWEIIHTNNHRDNDIPGEQREEYVAIAADLLARAIWRLAESGGIPPEEKQKTGEEAIARARQSLEFYTQEDRTESKDAAAAMSVLADVLDYFRDCDNDEVLRLYQQAIAIYSRVEGSMSMNMGLRVINLGNAYNRRAAKAHTANELEQYAANLVLALPHYREAARICSAANHMEATGGALRLVANVEEKLRQVGIDRAAAAGARV